MGWRRKWQNRPILTHATQTDDADHARNPIAPQHLNENFDHADTWQAGRSCDKQKVAGEAASVENGIRSLHLFD